MAAGEQTRRGRARRVRDALTDRARSMPRTIVIDPDDVDPTVVRAGGATCSATASSSPIRPTRSTASRSIRGMRQAVCGCTQLKGRAESSALPLIAADLAQAEACGPLSPDRTQLATHWWPGPLTIVVRAQPIHRARGARRRRTRLACAYRITRLRGRWRERSASASPRPARTGRAATGSVDGRRRARRRCRTWTLIDGGRRAAARRRRSSTPSGALRLIRAGRDRRGTAC